MSTHPGVSICVPTYNNALYIGTMLDSILKQSYTDYELIISDDVSSDNTAEVVGKIHDPRVRYYRNSVRMPVGEYNFNKAAGYATADLIAIYHSDDIYRPDIVEKEVKYLTDNPGIGAVFTFADQIDSEGNFICNFEFPGRFAKGGNFDFYEIFISLLKFGMAPLICPSVMLRKSVIEDVGLFHPAEFGTSCDTEMWLRLLEKYPVGIIPEKLMSYRISKSQISYRYHYLRTEEATFIKAAEAYTNSPVLTSGQKRRVSGELYWARQIDKVYRAIGYCLKEEDKSSEALLKEALSLRFISSCMFRKKGIKFLFIAIVMLLGFILGLNSLTRKLVGFSYRRRWRL